MDQPLRVTTPYLPPLEEFVARLADVWESGQLTNQGPLVRQFEELVREGEGLERPVHMVANGSLGLQIILRAMGVTGEVITTPFSYVATTSCPLWEGCDIRYADIESDHLTLDPRALEAAINPRTEAILATHVYGNPCDCDALEAIASKHGLALIYDAAHAYGVRYQQRSILAYGDASMVSLHATKLLHAVEGGLMYSGDPEVSGKLEWMRRFGHDGEVAYHGVGINAKMSEIHAAMGLCVHSHLDEILVSRHAVCAAYDEGLTKLSGIRRAFNLRDETQWNASYFPVRFVCENDLLRVLVSLNKLNIFPRRYFQPALHEAGLVKCDGQYPEAEKASREICCLPLSASMKQEDVERVVEGLSCVL